MMSQVMSVLEAVEFLHSLDEHTAEDLPNPWHGSKIETDGLVVIVEEWGYLTSKMLVSIFDSSEYNA